MNKLRRRSTSTEFEIERGIEFRHQLRNAANIKLPFAWYPNVDGIRHSVAAIQQPLLFHFFVPSIRTFHQKKDRDADIIKTRGKHFVHDATYFISSYGHRNSPCISFQPPTVLRTNTMKNKRIIITRSYCNCAATADKSMLSLFPPLPQRITSSRKGKMLVHTHRHEAGRYPQGRECYGPSMLILCKFIRYPKRVIFSRGDIWARVIPTTRMTCEIQMHKWWTKSIFSFSYTSNNNTGKMGA